MSNHRPHYGATGAAPSPASPRTPNTRTFLLPRSPGSNFSTETGLTHAEQEEYERGLLTWERAKNWRFWLRWAWVPWYLLGGVLAAGVCTVALYHRELIMLLMPFARHIQLARYGWLVPIGIMVVLSFPPLFGNEVVIILCGVVWGVRAGFLIVAAGTVVGEMACFTVYGTCCRRRARRMAHMSLNYACLTRVISSGGLFIAWVVRLSAIPTHVSTLLFAVCGLPYSQFFVALLLSLPKQFVAVYRTSTNLPVQLTTHNSRSHGHAPRTYAQVKHPLVHCRRVQRPRHPPRAALRAPQDAQGPQRRVPRHARGPRAPRRARARATRHGRRVRVRPARGVAPWEPRSP